MRGVLILDSSPINPVPILLARMFALRFRQRGIVGILIFQWPLKLSRIPYAPASKNKHRLDGAEDAGGGRVGGPVLGGIGAASTARDVKFQKIDKTTFKLEFVWKPTTSSERQAAAAQAAAATSDTTPMPESNPTTTPVTTPATPPDETP